jgi:sugar phosphate isomerase/epimerase
MGAAVVSTSAALPLAKRLAPFAERGHVLLSLETQADATKPGAVASPAQFDNALALSKSIRLKLDAGAVTAANGDAVAALKNFRSQITQVQITDRTRNGGKSLKFGDGDTPIGAILAAVVARAERMPVFIAYDYVGLGSAAEEVARCVEYVRTAAG